MTRVFFQGLFGNHACINFLVAPTRKFFIRFLFFHEIFYGHFRNFGCINRFGSLGNMLHFTNLNIIQNNKNAAFPFPSLRATILVCLHSFSHWFTAYPVSFVSSSIWPNFHTVSFRFSFIPFTIINLTIGKLTLSFQKFALFPLTLEYRTVWQNLFAEASRHAIYPSSVKYRTIRQNFLT